MANSILKKHQLDITVGVELNDAQRKATSAQIKNMASQWQDMLDDAIKKGIEDGARSASLKDVLTQFGYACKQLGIDLKTTSISQAKGLIERTESSKTILTEDNKELLKD